MFRRFLSFLRPGVGPQKAAVLPVERSRAPVALHREHSVEQEQLQDRLRSCREVLLQEARYERLEELLPLFLGVDLDQYQLLYDYVQPHLAEQPGRYLLRAHGPMPPREPLPEARATAIPVYLPLLNNLPYLQFASEFLQLEKGCPLDKHDSRDLYEKVFIWRFDYCGIHVIFTCRFSSGATLYCEEKSPVNQSILWELGEELMQAMDARFGILDQKFAHYRPRVMLDFAAVYEGRDLKADES